MSAFIEKEKLLEWLKKHTDALYNVKIAKGSVPPEDEAYAWMEAVDIVIEEIEAGWFDWSGESE